MFGKSLNVLGLLIMVLAFVAMSYWALAIEKPRAMALMAAGKWTMWDEILDKLIIISFGLIIYLGYIVEVLPRYEGNWWQAAKSGIGTLISSLILGALISLISRR